MKKVVLVAVMGLLGFGASAQKVGKVNMGKSTAATQQSVLTSQKSVVSMKNTGIMMNDPKQVTNQFSNGEILMAGDNVYIKFMEMNQYFEFKGIVSQASFSQLYVYGKDLVTGQSLSIIVSNATTGKPDDVLQIEIPSTGDLFIFKSL